MEISDERKLIMYKVKKYMEKVPYQDVLYWAKRWLNEKIGVDNLSTLEERSLSRIVNDCISDYRKDLVSRFSGEIGPEAVSENLEEEAGERWMLFNYGVIYWGGAFDTVILRIEKNHFHRTRGGFYSKDR